MKGLPEGSFFPKGKEKKEKGMIGEKAVFPKRGFREVSFPRRPTNEGLEMGQHSHLSKKKKRREGL